MGRRDDSAGDREPGQRFAMKWGLDEAFGSTSYVSVCLRWCRVCLRVLKYIGIVHLYNLGVDFWSHT